MQAHPPLATLLEGLLLQELRALGSDVTPDVERAARVEFERLLGALREGEVGNARSAVACADLEQALSLAMRAAEVQAGRETSPPERGDAPPSVEDEVRRLLGDSMPPMPGLDDDVGEVFDGKYEIQELLAEGGFGKVYRARDRDLDCAVAIKLLKPVAGEPRAYLEAFKEEARRLTRLKHPNIVEWKTLNPTKDGRLYLVMEFLEGEVLESALRREGRMAPARVARILLQVLDALQHAHALPDGSSLLHLDLKPTNVFLVKGRAGEERVKVLDFGISRFVGQEHGAMPGVAAGCTRLGETTRVRTGDSARADSAGLGVACTPLYCSPEQAARVLGGEEERALDGRTDLYSLGVMGYRMLVGRLPFEDRGDLQGMLRLHRDTLPPPIASHGVKVPRRLARFVERCLRKDPDERFESTQEAHAELRRVVEPRAASLLVGLASVAALACAILYSVGSRREVLPPLQVVLPAEGRSLADGTVYFGPSQPSHPLDLLDLDPEAELGGMRLAKEPRAGAASVAGWIVERAGERRVEIRAEGPAESRHELAFLEIDADGERRFTGPFELRYVQPSDWSIVSADTAARGQRRLAPAFQQLEIVVEGERELLRDGVEVEVAATRFVARRDESRSSRGRSSYRLDLGAVAWQSGSNVVHVHARDLAGNTHTESVELDVVDQPLRIESCRLARGTYAAGRWHVLAGEDVELSLECNRRARASWSVVSSSGRVLRSGTTPAGATSHRIDLEAADWGAGSFGGTIQVSLDEQEWVAHAPESSAGVASQDLELEVRLVGATFEALLSGARQRIEEEWKEPVQYVAEDTLQVAILRNHDVPMHVSARLVPGDGEAPVHSAAELSFIAPQELRKTVELALTADGCYRLVLEGRRLDADERPFETPDVRRELIVVRDTTAPVVSLEGWEEERVIRSREELEGLHLSLRADDRSWTPDPPPITLAWSLELESQEGSSTVSSSELTLGPGASIPFSPASERQESGPAGPDGVYTLTLRARDFAGNLDVEGREYSLSASTEGPRLRVRIPAAGGSWARFEERFAVELRAEDANGVSSVECELADPRGALPPQKIALVPLASATAGAGLWEGGFTLDHRWSGREARLRFRGTDTLGTETLEPVIATCVVSPIPNAVPAHVMVSLAGRGSSLMRRIAGNREATYLFGGRGDALENSAFRASGLPDFSTSAITSSLRVEIPRGAIEDFYLDELEVSVAQYLEFVRAPDGYADRRSWEAGAPDERRRVELEQSLSSSAADLPATGVTFDEAQAFARWAGKELPTYLHWEFAVRGIGARPFSFAGSAELAALGTGVNVATDGPWPIARGEDRTPDTGIVDLCSNVSEWTSTPARERLSEVTARELLARGPAGEAARFHVVGGSYARTVFHFGVVARHKREHAADSIGFRCMLPAATLEAAFLGGEGGYEVAPVR